MQPGPAQDSSRAGTGGGRGGRPCTSRSANTRARVACWIGSPRRCGTALCRCSRERPASEAARCGQCAADAGDPVQHAQALGGGRRQAPGHAQGEGGAGAQARHRAPPDLGGRDGVPLGQGPSGGRGGVGARRPTRVRGGAERPGSHKVPSPGRGDGEAGSAAVAGSDPVPRWVDCSAGSLRQHDVAAPRRPRAEARDRRQDALWSLTTDGPLQKQRNRKSDWRRRLPMTLRHRRRSATPSSVHIQPKS